MKRYNITIESGFNNQRRIKIASVDNGEWVRYEDVDDALGQAQSEIAPHQAQYENIVGYVQDRQERIDQLEAALKVYEGIVAESRGVDGWHLNGDIAEWGEFDLPQIAADSKPEKIPESYGGTNG